VEYRRLGSAGVKVSEICLGMMGYGDPNWKSWVLDEKATLPFVERAAAAGVNFFDTADMYSTGVSEEVTGRTLKQVFSRREDYVLASKVYMPMGDGPNDGGLSRKHIIEAVDASLKRLNVDYIDLYQIHRWDDETPIEETLETLNDLVRAGKVLYLGASSMPVWKFVMAQYVAKMHGWTPFISMQNQINLLYREEEREMLPYCIDQGIGVIPWSPLARGRLARAKDQFDQSTRGQSDHRITLYGGNEWGVTDALAEVADARGESRAKVALAWVMQKPGVTAPIIGATKLDQLDEAIAATELTLTAEEVKILEAPYTPQEPHNM
jgi:1-deoxyxylulose-5-phosphate synthase